MTSQKKARQPLVSLLYVQPPAQSSALGRVICGQARPARLRRSRETLFIAVKTTTRRINASVRKMIKFQDARSVRLKAAEGGRLRAIAKSSVVQNQIACQEGKYAF